MRRLRFRFKVLWIFFCGIIFFTAVFNIILTFKKSALISYIEKQSPFRVTLSRVVYLPPNFIIFRNTSLGRPEPTVHNSVIFVPTAVAQFSLFKILTKGKLIFSGAYLYKPNLGYLDLPNFSKGVLKQLAVFILNLPKQDINLFVKGLRLDLTKENSSPEYILADLIVRARGDSISSSGLIKKYKAGHPSEENPIKYILKAYLSHGVISIENLELKSSNYFAQINAKYTKGNFQLKGYAFMNKVTVGWLRDAKLQLLDINLYGNFSFPKLQVKRLTFSLNNNPVFLRGGALLSSSILLDLNISSVLNNLEMQALRDVGRATLKFKAKVSMNSFKGSGEFDFEPINKKDNRLALGKFNFRFNGLNLNFSGYPNLKSSLRGGEFYYLMREDQYSFMLSDLAATFYLNGKTKRLVDFNALLYGGAIDGRGWLDMDRKPLRLAAIFRLRNVNANKLDSLLVHFAKIFGKLDGRVYFSNIPRPSLRGDIVIRKGYLQEFDFFKWLADFFNLTGFNRIDFNKALTKFLVDAEGANLYRMHLDSKDVNLRGYFKVRSDELVSSKISLTLSRELLEGSRKLTPLLNLLGKDFRNLVFDFQLSGNFHRMNFKWLDSEFKRKVHSSIPGFIERGIDRGISKAIESLATEE